MANLNLTFSDVYTEVAEFLGLGSSPTGTDLTNVKNITHRGYRRFLFPVDPIAGKAYIWSFRRKTSKFITKSGQWEYELPDDFSYFTVEPKFAEGENYPNPESRSASQIYSLRTADNTTSYPEYYGLRTGDYDPQIGQVYEVVFWPTPDSAYTYTYEYIMEPVKLVNDDDVFIGGATASECILEMALATAELQEDDTVGIHTQTAVALVNQLIAEDKRRTPKNLGLNLDPSVIISRRGIHRPYYRVNDINYDV
jgi:hypothetical protein